MVKGKDFYGSTVTDAIAEACQEFSTSQDALNIDILETGSSGIFGLCRKKAHIRVAKKVEKESPEQKIEREKAPQKTAHKGNKGSGNRRQDGKKSLQKTAQKSVQGTEVHQASQATPELPADEVLAEIQEDISTMLDLMGFPSTVTVTLKKYTVAYHSLVHRRYRTGTPDKERQNHIVENNYIPNRHHGQVFRYIHILSIFCEIIHTG